MDLTVEPKLQEYLASLKTEGTRETYRIALSQFSVFLKDQGVICSNDSIVHRFETVQSWLEAVDADRTRGAMSKERTNIARKTLTSFSESLQGQGLAPDSVRCYMGCVQNLYLFVFEEKFSLKFSKLPDALEQSQKHPWSLESLSRFLSMFTDPMYRCLGCLLLQSGLSLSDALTLTLSDLPEFGKKCPMELNFIARGRKKTKVPFSTFVGALTIELLGSYLADKHLGPQDRIFPVSSQSVQSYFRVRARKLLEEGWPYRCPMSPHSFRSAFRTLAHRSKQIDDDDLEFFMAHKQGRDMAAIYNKNGPEYYRQVYASIEPFLTVKLEPPLPKAV